MWDPAAPITKPWSRPKKGLLTSLPPPPTFCHGLAGDRETKSEKPSTKGDSHTIISSSLGILDTPIHARCDFQDIGWIQPEKSAIWDPATLTCMRCCLSHVGFNLLCPPMSFMLTSEMLILYKALLHIP